MEMFVACKILGLCIWLESHIHFNILQVPQFFLELVLEISANLQACIA